MREWLEAVFVPCEGLALVQTMRAWNEQDWPQLELLDAELTALKPASETRKSSATLGSRLLKTALPLFPETNLEALETALAEGRLRGNQVLVQGVLYAVLNLSHEEALSALAYARLNGMVSAVLRLFALCGHRAFLRGRVGQRPRGCHACCDGVRPGRTHDHTDRARDRRA